MAGIPAGGVHGDPGGRQVVILHGWSDTSDSFTDMAEFLKDSGIRPVPLWLGDYPSMSDHVRIEDIVRRMDKVLAGDNRMSGLDESFDMIVHSTGGLVARKWITTFYPDGTGCPVKRLIMVAPANFGSKLASTGKSPLGRVFKGFKHGGEVGEELLNALELASDFLWDLAQEDLFASEGEPTDGAASPYGPDGVWPFVITGSHPYLDGFRQVVNEDGSDGTIRVAAANLNAYGVTIDLRLKDDDDGFSRRWPLRHAAYQTYKEDGRARQHFAFAAIPDRDHSTITEPGAERVVRNGAAGSKLPDLLREALACNSFVDYQAVASHWEEISEETHGLAGMTEEQREAIFPNDHKDLKPEYFHQYFQIVVRVVDDQDYPVDDFYLEFFNGNARGDDGAVIFHRDVLSHVHPGVGETRCFYINRTDLMERFYKSLPGRAKKTLNASVSAARPGEYVQYFGRNVKGRSIPAHSFAKDGRFLRRNCTHFIKIIVPRTQVDRTFKLTPAPEA